MMSPYWCSCKMKCHYCRMITDQTTILGQAVQFDVVVGGLPKPTVTWYKVRFSKFWFVLFSKKGCFENSNNFDENFWKKQCCSFVFITNLSICLSIYPSVYPCRTAAPSHRMCDSKSWTTTTSIHYWSAILSPPIRVGEYRKFLFLFSIRIFLIILINIK